MRLGDGQILQKIKELWASAENKVSVDLYSDFFDRQKLFALKSYYIPCPRVNKQENMASIQMFTTEVGYL